MNNKINFFIFSLLFMSLQACKTLSVYEEKFTTWEERKVALKAEIAVLETDVEKTNYLRQFVAGFVDLGSDEINSSNYVLTHNINVNENYSDFVNDKMTVVCGGAAFFLMSVYKDFGYEAFTYDVGGETATHQFCLVKIKDNKQDKLIIQDPYFDHTVSYESGELMDFSAMIHFLKVGLNDSIYFLKTYTVGNSLLNTRIYPWRHWQLQKKKKYTLYKSKNKSAPFLIRQERSMDSYLVGSLKRRYYTFLSKNAYPRDIKYLFLFPLPHNEAWIINIVNEVN